MIKHLRKTSSGAKIIDGRLTLFFPEAKHPVLWHMDIAETKSCSFEVQNGNKNDSGFILVMKKEDEPVKEIAAFETSDIATAALTSIVEALEKSRGGAFPSSSENVEKSESIIKKMAGTVAAIAILVILIGLFFSSTLTPPTSIPYASSGENSAQGTAGEASIGTTNAADTIGAPVSADAFLINRQ